MERKNFKTLLGFLLAIIDDLAPDYLVLEMEPETQAVNLGHRVDYEADSVVVYVNYFLSHLNKRNTQLGAGAGRKFSRATCSAFGRPLTRSSSKP